MEAQNYIQYLNSLVLRSEHLLSLCLDYGITLDIDLVVQCFYRQNFVNKENNLVVYQGVVLQS